MSTNTITVNELSKITSGYATDLLLATRGTTGHKMNFGDFAKYVTETYQAAVAGQNQSIIDALNEVHTAIGGPQVAATAAAMTDQSKIYVYTGSETGYTAGNWYYYNGSAWTSGGIYNAVAVQTDPSLSEEGVAADAKATGDAIDAATVAIDDTLTQTGEAADAKKTGDEISELKNALNEKAPAIILDSGLKHTFSAEEMQEVVDFSVVIPPTVSTSMNVMLGQDIIPSLDAYSNTWAYKEEGNNFLVINGSPESNRTYYGRVNTSGSFASTIPISSGDTVYITYYITGDVTALQGGTEPVRAALTLRYNNGTSKTKFYGFGITKRGLLGTSITAEDDVVSINFEIMARTGYTFTDYTVYFVATKADATTYTNLSDDLILTKEQTGTNGITLIPNNGYMHYIADTKTYIDNNIPDDVVTEKKLVYLTPEMYGAIGDGVTNDITAIQDCLADATLLGLPVRGFGKYATDTTISISSSNGNIFLHRIIYSGLGSAITVVGKRNYIYITVINASNGCALTLTTNGDDTNYNEIHINNIYAGLNAIEIYQEQSESERSIYYNRLYLGQSTSRNGNIIYLDCYRFAENIIFGNSVSCVNGWAVYTNKSSGTRNTIIGFCMEHSCGNGIYGNFFIQNCRTVECMDLKRPDNNLGTIIKAKPMSTAIKWDDSTYVDYDAVDVSECRTYDESIEIVKEAYESGTSKALSFDAGFGYYHDNFMGHAFRLGIYHNMPNQTGSGFPKRGHIIGYFNHKGFVPENGWYVQVNSATYTPFLTEAAFPTEFDLQTNCTINLEDSYCCVGINNVIIHQYASAKAIVYDKHNNLIFDGTSLDAGTYKLSCIMIPHTITIQTNRGEIEYTRDDIYFGMNDKWTVEKLNIVS